MAYLGWRLHTANELVDRAMGRSDGEGDREGGGRRRCARCAAALYLLGVFQDREREGVAGEDSQPIRRCQPA
jgi:hypothetical protein